MWAYFWTFIKAFVVGGALCAAGEALILKTRLTSARILVGYVTAGVILGAAGIWQPLADWAGAGATVPLLGFGNSLAQGALRAVKSRGVLGARGASPPFHALSHPPPRACRRPDAAGIRETTGQPGARKPGIRW